MTKLTLLSIDGRILATVDVTEEVLYDIRGTLNLALDYASDPIRFDDLVSRTPEAYRDWMRDMQKNLAPNAFCFIEDWDDTWFITDMAKFRKPLIKLDYSTVASTHIVSESS